MKKICWILVAVMLFGSSVVCFAQYDDNTTPEEYANASVIASYTAAYGKQQGENNFYFCEYRDDMVNELNFDSSNRWSKNNSFPIYSPDGSTTPANDADSNLKFVAPMKGTIRLKGKVGFTQWRKPGEGGNGVIVSIIKKNTVLWTATVPEAGSVNYDICTSIKAGEELHFRVNAKDKNNGWDTTLWWPAVEYLGVEYIPDLGSNLYFQKNGEELKQLSYNEDVDAYFADDEMAFISENAVMPTDDYSLIKRFTIKENGRYRVSGTVLSENVNSSGIVVGVYKNGSKVWSQLFPEREEGILDIRMLAEKDDVIDIEFSTNEYEGFNWSSVSCDVKKFVGTLFCNASTSAGDTYGIDEVYTLSSFIGTTQGGGAEYYSRQYDVNHPLTYNSSSKKWEDKWEGHAFNDQGYISATTVKPGHLADICVDVTLPKTGTLKIDGNLPVSSAGDGVLTKIYLNDQLLWSSRVGGERSVRWDEPFDVSYFVNNISAVANVKAGDTLTFSFNRWRINSNDDTNIEDITLSYIRGNVLSKTTRWKLKNSIVADTTEACVYVNGEKKNIDIRVIDGTTYVEATGVEGLFGANTDGFEIKSIDGMEYVPLRAVAEASGKTVIWAANRMVLIHDGIPVLYGWPELSEIDTTLSRGGDLF